jgi:hypothetical protein
MLPSQLGAVSHALSTRTWEVGSFTPRGSSLVVALVYHGTGYLLWSGQILEMPASVYLLAVQVLGKP